MHSASRCIIYLCFEFETTKSRNGFPCLFTVQHLKSYVYLPCFLPGAVIPCPGGMCRLLFVDFLLDKLVLALQLSSITAFKYSWHPMMKDVCLSQVLLGSIKKEQTSGVLVDFFFNLLFLFSFLSKRICKSLFSVLF